MNFKKMLVLLGVMIVVGAVLAACGGTQPLHLPRKQQKPLLLLHCQIPLIWLNGKAPPTMM